MSLLTHHYYRFVFVGLLWLLLSAAVPAADVSPPSLLLAKVYHQGVDLKHYWVSEKLDGVRAYWDGEQFWSRGGHVYQAPDWFTEGFPDHPLDGELWSGREQFAQLSGVVRKHQPVDREWRKVRFHAFDLPLENTSFEVRYQRL